VKLQGRASGVAGGGGLVLLIAGLGVTLASPPAPRLVWNASASAPIGLYLVHPGALPGRGEYVVAHLPSPLRDLATRRRYLPANVPLVKRVAAAAGERVCARGAIVTVEGKPIARRLAVDSAGRMMPGWSGCARLSRGDFFLLMATSPRSFDGRYFGPIHHDQIIGRARLLWAR
jgi:conjugative transfer signal peptidase TraF